MAKVKFTQALTRFFPEISDMEVEGSTIWEVVQKIEKELPGISSYILEEDGRLRKHVNIFLEDDMIEDTVHLSDHVSDNQEVLIYQALSGG